MFYFKIFIAVFAVIGALDFLFGNKLKLGSEFTKGIFLFGDMALSMIGLIVLSPFIAQLLSPFFDFIADNTPFDPSIIVASLFANDMGGSELCTSIAKTEILGNFNGFIVSSMMGCTVSFTLPVSLSIVKESKRKELCLGILCGVATIPVGCFVSGLLYGVPFADLLIDICPLVVFAAIIVFGLIKAPNTCINVFKIIGFAVKIIIYVGLCIGIVEFLTGIEILGNQNKLSDAALVCVNAVIVLSGMLPFFAILSRILKKPLKMLENNSKMNEKSVMGLLGSLMTNVTTFGMMNEMDGKGAIINSAFAVSGAFIFGGHLAYTMAYCEEAVPFVLIGKAVAGVTAIVLAFVIAERNEEK